jgi:hypothetical protein
MMAPKCGQNRGFHPLGCLLILHDTTRGFRGIGKRSRFRHAI